MGQREDLLLETVLVDLSFPGAPPPELVITSTVYDQNRGKCSG